MVPADEEGNKKLFPAQRPNQKGSIGILQQVALIFTDDDPAEKCPTLTNRMILEKKIKVIVGKIVQKIDLEKHDRFD